MKIHFKMLLGASVIGASLFAGCGDSATDAPGDAATDVAKTDAVVGDAGNTDAVVDSSVPTFTVGGTITGYTGTGLVLENGPESVTIPKSGTTYTLSKQVPAGTAYDIKVKTQPSNPTQTCTVTNGTGTVTANINNINVNCVTNTYDVKATVVGLKGTGLVLQNNAADDLAVSVGDGGASTTATFATKVASGANFAVTVKTQPSMQTCTVMGGTGTVVAGPITTVTVTCETNKYTVGGTVAGLAGAGLVLQNNAGDDATVNANGTYAFATAPEDGTAYAVTVKTQPTNLSQTCTVANGTGTINGANVTNVDITCTTNTYTVGVTVSGLSGSGLVLQNNAGDNLAIGANGAFTFSTAVLSGGAFAVTTLTNPTGPSQTCAVTSGSGTVTDANVTNVVVTCTTNGYTIGGNVSGLAVPGLVLRNNGGNDLTVNASGAFTFTAPVLSGATYAVTVQTQPAGLTCTVASGSGTVVNANITNVSVTCVAPVSCFAIKQANPSATDGNYTVDVDGSGPLAALSVYCDMTTDGGGYLSYAINAGIPTTRFDQANSCTALGMNIAIPRTKAHLTALHTKYGAGYFRTVPGVYGLAAINHSGQVFNSSNPTVAANWKSLDGKAWFAKDIAHNEPNGDYTPGCWLGTYGPGTLNASGFEGWNDGNCDYSTGTTYVCSDNLKATCGNSTLEATEERDPAPGPFSSAPVNALTCRYDFSTVQQLYCNGSCSWGGGGSCDQADADIFCKLRTGSATSTASSFATAPALAVPGFSCGSGGYGTNIGALPGRGVNQAVWYQDTSILANHGNGTVIVNPVCTP